MYHSISKTLNKKKPKDEIHSIVHLYDIAFSKGIFSNILQLLNFITVGVRASFYVTRLVLRGPKVNNQGNPLVALRKLELVTAKEQTQNQTNRATLQG